MKIEYLIIVKQEESFCDTREAFLSFLSVDSSIEIKEDTIRFSREEGVPTLVAQFSVETGEIPDKDERYFHIMIDSREDDEPEILVSLADKIKEISSRIKPGATRVNTLWNEVGRQYAIQAYPKINEVENLMRKLISKFMLINVGMDWSQEAIHREILSAIENRHGKQGSYSDILHKTDFIHLSRILFRKYRTLDLNELDRILLSEESSQETFQRIKKILPKSNWERYFSEIIDYNEESLKTKWKLLYDLRNNVAHNRYISRSDLEKILGIANEIKGVLAQTIDELDNIDLTEEDRENIILSYQPTSWLAKAYLAEKAVAEWYIENYSVRELFGGDDKSLLDLPFDILILTEDDRKIAVEVKSTSSRSISRQFNFVKSRYTHAVSRSIDEDQISEFHFVFVFQDPLDLNDVSRERLKFTLKDLLSSNSQQVKLIMGYLNSDDQFVNVEI
jgi:hypothetical protein